MIEDIANSSGEQATAVAQVNIGMSQIAEVIQTNSATAEESAAASEELSSQSMLLKQAVQRFRLKEEFSIGNSDEAMPKGLREADFGSGFGNKYGKY